MTFGSGGGSPKTISIVTDTAPVVQAFSNRDFYTCPLDTLAIVTPLLFSYGSGSNGDPDVFNFAGITVKQTDPILGSIIRYSTQYGAISGAPYSPSPNYGRTFLYPTVPDTTQFFAQRYEKYALSSFWNGSAEVSKGVGGGIILFPGETLSWGASDNYTNSCQWRLRYGLLEYGISS